MKVKKRVTHYRRSPMSIVQYVIGIIIIMVFVLSLIPGIYKNLFHIQILLILIQLFISVFRIRFLNVFFEVILLILAIVIAVPSLFKDWFLIGFVLLVINYVFIVLAILVALVDMSTFKSNMIYKRVEIFTGTCGASRSKKKGVSGSKNIGSKGKKKKKPVAKDVNFKEKKKEKKESSSGD